jgi:hypothetical protein
MSKKKEEKLKKLEPYKTPAERRVAIGNNYRSLIVVEI